jgi:hypothetical protein
MRYIYSLKKKAENKERRKGKVSVIPLGGVEIFPGYVETLLDV